MPPATFQIPSIILPDISAQRSWTGLERETIDDLVEHTSTEFPVESLQEKEIQIVAIETALAPGAIPGNLWCWVEVSTMPSANNNYWESPLPTSALYWAAIGGGGGALPAIAPVIEVSGLGGAPGVLFHPIILPWSIHSFWARLVVQTPVAAALPLATWEIQCMFTAKTP